MLKLKPLLFYLIVVLLIVSSCSSFSKEDTDVPGDLISRDKMIVILADMQITEAFLDDLRKTGIRTNDSSLLYFQKVFKKNQVSPMEFENSLLYYKKNLEQMDMIYTDVVTRLNELKAKNDEILLQMKADSLRLDSVKIIDSFIDSLSLSSDSLYVQDSLALDSIIKHHFGNKSN
ncbi:MULTISPECIES: DUF4296 domain-containing protein [unclassified Lentimicrobium]|uniref:DUF4296 domain-containing protein n=1 Tax=unclassified Lentimicrobium TaxID=2677434 RepID=UPI00155210E9|nr:MULTISPECIES: DUF4296 domain-containing protein [unclassified Lentimicrobium]NPD45101.1 DUF4296 domain-containing protein [Lentimicrobium sp. S6]NPD85382.1 DUF4296 domain-containing protein [Lentimicrobium sp. L6]